MNLFKKFIAIPFTVLITSLYYFPIQVRWFPALNSKMALAAIGLGLFAINLVKERNASIKKEILVAGAFALIVSLIGIISTTYNNTSDYAYASYIISYLVWVFGAYTVVSTIKSIHEKIDVWTVVNYIAAVCAFQCITALMITMIPAFQHFVDSWLVGFGFTSLADVKDIGRMYGIGATLDVAGARFCPVLVAIAVCIRYSGENNREKYLWIYMLAFLFIAIIGNMMGRTTTIGMILGLLIILFPSEFSFTISKESIKRIGWLLSIIIGVSLIFVLLYNISPIFQKNLRFGFEGFFSLFETGEWHTNSNERLANMVVFPETFKTWIIGDGYFDGAAYDLNFLGDATMTAYYMKTDIGYLRFIFYFGIVGLISFIVYFAYCCFCCIKLSKNSQWVFILTFILTLIIWAKVSTDIFVFIALFLWLNKEECVPLSPPVPICQTSPIRVRNESYTQEL